MNNVQRTQPNYKINGKDIKLGTSNNNDNNNKKRQERKFLRY